MPPGHEKSPEDDAPTGSEVVPGGVKGCMRRALGRGIGRSRQIGFDYRDRPGSRQSPPEGSKGLSGCRPPGHPAADVGARDFCMRKANQPAKPGRLAPRASPLSCTLSARRSCRTWEAYFGATTVRNSRVRFVSTRAVSAAYLANTPHHISSRGQRLARDRNARLQAAGQYDACTWTLLLVPKLGAHCARALGAGLAIREHSPAHPAFVVRPDRESREGADESRRTHDKRACRSIG